MQKLNIPEKQAHEIATAMMAKYGEVYFFKNSELNAVVAKVNEIIADKADKSALDSYLAKPVEIVTSLQYALIKSGSTWSWAEVVTMKNGDIALSEPRVIDTAGNPFTIESLPSKSADATFQDVLGMNSNGQLAKIGYPAFAKQAESWTQTQRDEFAQILNGGFSTGTMGVNLISPPLFELEDNDVYVVLRGANLNLHPTNRKIEILDAADNSILAEVPNGQVQTYADGLQLVFYYNFNSLGVGTYKLKITNGAATYITSLNFQIVAEVTNIDLSAITWNKIIDPQVVNDKSYGSGATAYLNSNIETLTSTPIISLLSSELFEPGEDFFLEIQVTTGIGNMKNQPDIGRVGIIYSSIPNQLNYLPIHFWAFGKTGSSQMLLPRVNPNSSYVYGSGTSTTSQNLIISITKLANVITITDGHQTGVVSVSNSEGYSLVAQMNGVDVLGQTQWEENFSIQILKAYKFN